MFAFFFPAARQPVPASRTAFAHQTWQMALQGAGQLLAGILLLVIAQGKMPALATPQFWGATGAVVAVCFLLVGSALLIEATLVTVTQFVPWYGRLPRYREQRLWGWGKLLGLWGVTEPARLDAIQGGRSLCWGLGCQPKTMSLPHRGFCYTNSLRLPPEPSAQLVS